MGLNEDVSIYTIFSIMFLMLTINSIRNLLKERKQWTRKKNKIRGQPLESRTTVFLVWLNSYQILNFFFIPWAFSLLGLVLSNVVVVLAAVFSILRAYYNIAFSAENYSFDSLLVNFLVFVLCTMTMGQSITFVNRHVNDVMGVTKLKHPFGVVFVTFFIVCLALVVNYRVTYYSILFSAFVVAVTIGFVVCNTVKHGFHYSSDMLLPSSYANAFTGALLLLRAFIPDWNSNAFSIYFSSVRKYSFELYRNFILAKYAVITLVCLFLGNVVYLSAAGAPSYLMHLSYDDFYFGKWFQLGYALLMTLETTKYFVIIFERWNWRLIAECNDCTRRDTGDLKSHYREFFLHLVMALFSLIVSGINTHFGYMQLIVVMIHLFTTVIIDASNRNRFEHTSFEKELNFLFLFLLLPLLALICLGGYSLHEAYKK